MLNKAKQKLTSDEQGTDNILDKAADFAKSKFSGQAETIDKVRDAIDDKIGSGDKGGPGTTADRPDKPVEPTDARAETGGTGPLAAPNSASVPLTARLARLASNVDAPTPSYTAATPSPSVSSRIRSPNAFGSSG